jgi:hypothetical protein
LSPYVTVVLNVPVWPPENAIRVPVTRVHAYEYGGVPLAAVAVIVPDNDPGVERLRLSGDGLAEIVGATGALTASVTPTDWVPVRPAASVTVTCHVSVAVCPAARLALSVVEFEVPDAR